VWKSVLLPPFSILVGLLAALIVSSVRPRLGRILLVACIFALYALSTPLVAGLLMDGLEPYPAVDPDSPTADAQAIVVLAAGRYSNSPEYGGDTIGPLTLTRLRYGAFLHRRTGRPILVTGQAAGPDQTAAADLMADSLRNEFGIEARWVENESDDTAGNARYSADILLPAGIRRVYLVTHAWHMRRAVLAFEAAGFEVVPAPTAFTTHHPFVWPGVPSDYVPSAGALAGSAYAVHEWLGLAWYALRYG
jgi:uncharacterized SAM-binding protein YcdF (DUF218 family)